MSIRNQLLPELDQEMATTRRVLAAIPAGRAGFRPHARSWTMGELAQRLANVPRWLPMTMQASSFDVAPVGGPPPRSPRFESLQGTLYAFDANVTAARAALAAAEDADFGVACTLLQAGRPRFTMPRAAVLRGFVFGHLIHHRGQLTVYLRLCDAPVPEVYGPTADSA